MKSKKTVVIYAIAKNEEKNVKRFLASCEEADGVYVTDTGSTDRTVKLLREGGAKVFSAKVDPWRWDTARNISLKNVPKDVDICVCIDLDETLRPGWRTVAEEAFNDGCELIDYLFIELRNNHSSFRSRIHSRGGWKWQKPIHEICVPSNKRQIKRLTTDKIVVEHHRQHSTNYLNQLNSFIKENPDFPDSYIQRGADYITLKKYDKAIKDYKKYLEITYKDEDEMTKNRRSFAHLSIAEALRAQDAPAEKIIERFLHAVAEDPGNKPAWAYLADGWMAVGNYPQAYAASMTALSMSEGGSRARVNFGDRINTIARESIVHILNRVKGGGS